MVLPRFVLCQPSAHLPVGTGHSQFSLFVCSFPRGAGIRCEPDEVEPKVLGKREQLHSILCGGRAPGWVVFRLLKFRGDLVSLCAEPAFQRTADWSSIQVAVIVGDPLVLITSAGCLGL